MIIFLYNGMEFCKSDQSFCKYDSNENLNLIDITVHLVQVTKKPLLGSPIQSNHLPFPRIEQSRHDTLRHIQPPVVNDNKLLLLPFTKKSNKNSTVASQRNI
ncbi:hypothetical protein JTE90_008466 [Oedothorax gibbosus]|uniref:Uncharacterized protein n=1 Tax=Oedothorax gibbosus TaxID=931172 RepID=A0AAV6V151_9ARAC|nr:hypothetical protein JTE90_008466 [Oedothorax gibbosus]